MYQVKKDKFELRDAPYVVGILNATPDSFSDGGNIDSATDGFEQAMEMFEEGAAIVDVGGESTRPGFEPVSINDEIARVVPIVERIIEGSENRIVSIDTSKPEVAKEALKAGATIVNDIWGFRKEEALAEVCAGFGASCILMRNGRFRRESGSILDLVRSYWDRSVEIALAAGLGEEQVVLDPGIGFGTTREEDLEILASLRVLREYGFPLMLGSSRKRVTGEMFDLPVGERLETTLATTVSGVLQGVEFYRVHDVKENLRAARMAKLIGGR